MARHARSRVHRRQKAAAFPSLLSEDAPGPQGTGEQDGDYSFARDLNLDQIVAAVAGDREERDLVTRVLYTRLRAADAVRYRQEVFRDLEEPALLDEVQRFTDRIGEVRAHLRQLDQMRYRYQQEGWLLDAAAIYCDAVQSLAGYLASAQISSRALLAFRRYLASYAASAGFTALASDTRDRKEALGQIRYCTRIKGGRVEVSRYQDEADYSAAVLKTFDRFKQGEVKDYRIRYRTWPGMNHVAAQIVELVARLFPEEFTALDEYCGRHQGSSMRASGAPTPSSSSIWPTWTTSGRYGPPGCASAIPRSPPPARRSSPPTPSTLPWRTSSSRGAHR